MVNGRITHCVDARPCLSHIMLYPLILAIPILQTEKLRLRENKVTQLHRRKPRTVPQSHALILSGERRLKASK